MLVAGRPHRTIWLGHDGRTVEIIDQTQLPHTLRIVPLRGLEDAARAIADMQVRGAPLIGATAAYGMALAVAEDPSDDHVNAAYHRLFATRPTAVNLRWALDDLRERLLAAPLATRRDVAYRRAAEICDEDVQQCEAIGRHGAELIAELHAHRSRPLNVLTHCNAGWLATVDWGTALAPVYAAHADGLAVHVWVDETRPRNQGASLTAWELRQAGIPHTIIADNTGGHLMQSGKVDLCITGTDRTTARGDVCNKIGTYLKALAARDNGVPFYVAAPGPSIDWSLWDGVLDIPIEERDPSEVTHIRGRTPAGSLETVCLVPEGSRAANYGFDVTPARLVTALITERGTCSASPSGLLGLYPEHRAHAEQAERAHAHRSRP